MNDQDPPPVLPPAPPPRNPPPGRSRFGMRTRRKPQQAETDRPATPILPLFVAWRDRTSPPSWLIDAALTIFNKDDASLDRCRQHLEQLGWRLERIAKEQGDAGPDTPVVEAGRS